MVGQGFMMIIIISLRLTGTARLYTIISHTPPFLINLFNIYKRNGCTGKCWAGNKRQMRSPSHCASHYCWIYMPACKPANGLFPPPTLAGHRSVHASNLNLYGTVKLYTVPDWLKCARSHVRRLSLQLPACSGF